MQIKLEPLSSESRDSGIKASFHSFFEKSSTEFYLRRHGIQHCIVSDDILVNSNPIHFLEEFVSLFPKITACTSADGAVVNVYVWSNIFEPHAFH